MPCDACDALHKQPSSTPAHAALQLVDTEKWSQLAAGQARGVVHYYACATCGSKLVRDLDQRDPYAQWEIVG